MDIRPTGTTTGTQTSHILNAPAQQGQSSTVSELKSLFKQLLSPLASISKFNYEPVHQGIAEAKAQAHQPSQSTSAVSTTQAPTSASTASLPKVATQQAEAGFHKAGDRMDQVADRIANIFSNTLNKAAEQVKTGQLSSIATTLAEGAEQSGKTFNAGFKAAGSDVRKGMEKAAISIRKQSPQAAKKMQWAAKEMENGFQRSGQVFKKNLNSVAEKNRQWGQGLEKSMNPPKERSNDKAWDDFETWLNEAGDSLNQTSRAMENSYYAAGNQLSQTFMATGKAITPQNAPPQNNQEKSYTAPAQYSLGEQALYLSGMGLQNTSQKTGHAFNTAGKETAVGFSRTGQGFHKGFSFFGQSIKNTFTTFGQQTANTGKQTVNGLKFMGQYTGAKFQAFGENVANTSEKVGDGFVYGAVATGKGFSTMATELDKAFTTMGNGIATGFTSATNAASNATKKSTTAVVDVAIKKPANTVKKVFKSIF